VHRSNGPAAKTRRSRKLLAPRSKTHPSSRDPRLTGKASLILNLMRRAKLQTRGVKDGFAQFHLRRRSEERISSLADGIASKPFISRAGLIALALSRGPTPLAPGMRW
jgi:hypothetical protein